MKSNIVKKVGILIFSSILFASCTSSYEAIGNVSVLSDRAIKAGVAYKQLSINSGGTKEELKHSQAETLDEAVSQVISQVPGGRFITNVTIYVGDNGYYAVSGNVWGTPVGGDTVQHVPPMIASIHSR